MRRVFPTTVSFCLLVLLFSLCPTPAISQDSPTPYSKTAPESPQNADKGQTSKGYSLRDGNEPTGGNRPLEDFKSLNVASDLPFDVLALQDADFSGYRKELVRAQWRAGDPVDL